MRVRLRGAGLLLCGILGSGVPAPSRVGGVPAQLTVVDWQALRAEHERNRHAAFPEPGGYRARNFSQQWLTHFDGRGFEVEPDGGGWTWGLELAGFGERAQVTVDRQRVSYRWNAALEEWFVNDMRGLEHGFTLRERPPGAGERLEIRLAVRGGLHPRVEGGGRAVSFLNAAGRAVVNYAGLDVWDADGRSLAAHFQAETNLLRLVVDERGARYPLSIDPTAQQAYLKASNTGARDYFGRSAVVSGDTVVVAAILEDSNARGVNGDQTNNSVNDSGAVYVFVRTGTTWTQQAYLKASNPDRDDQFGTSVAVSGNTVVVGAYHESSNATGINGDQANNSALGSGAAYVFVRNGSTWTQQAYLKASNTSAGFGFSVAVSGETVVIGALAEASNATGVNGDQANNSAPRSGAAYVFVRDGVTWSQQAYLKASNTGVDDFFGLAVAVSGDTIVVGAPGEDSNATGVNGDQNNDSAGNAGAAYVFVRNGTAWTQQAYLKASNTGEGDGFGGSVAVSAGTLVVGASGEDSNATGVNGDQTNNSSSGSGAAYVFVGSGATWTQQAYLKASNTEAGDSFGTSVAVSGDTVVVGSPGESSNAPGVNGDQTNNLAPGSGAAYVFVGSHAARPAVPPRARHFPRSGTTWSQQAYLKASNPDPPIFDPALDFEASEFFGRSVAVSGDIAVVGAFGEASNATGVNGDQTNNSAGSSGAAYLFALESRTFALPQFAFGGGWHTALYFCNTGDSPVSFTVNFIGLHGTPLTVPLLGIGPVTSRTIDLNPGATVVLDAPNVGGLVQGWAEAAVPAGVIGYGVFRQSVAGRADQEAVVLATPVPSPEPI